MVMLLASALAAPGLGVIDQPLWQLQQTKVLWRTIASVLLNVGGVAIAATLLGLLTTRALHYPRRSLLTSAAGALLVVAVVTILCALCKDGWLPGVWPLYLLITLGGAVFGIGIALVMERAESPPLAFVLMSLLTGLVSIAGVAMLVGLLLQPAPLPIDGVTLDSADRVRLTQKIRAGSPRNMEPGSTKTLSLSSTDINKLSAWGLSLGDAGRMAFVNLTERDINGAVSLRWAPGLLSAPVYLNVSGTATPDITEGRLKPGISAARIGRLSLPAGLANYLASGLFDLVAADPRFAGAIRQLHRVKIDDRTLSATYGAMDLPEGLRKDVFGSLGDDEVVAVAFSQHLHLQRGLAAALAAQEITKDAALATIVERSFDLAARRHNEYGSDPVLENRLATIALGITLGHPKISEVVAQLPPEFGSMQRLWSQAPLQNRSDWTRHFWVSAALTCLSDQALSLDIGQLKEELDAGSQGGSGFSFGDLAADMAGVELAIAITSDPARARLLQRRLAQVDQFNQFVPALAGLPEGLTEQQLQQQYGGTEGRDYQQLVNEIGASISAQPGYRAGP
ncbi:MAG: hypothetical protein AB8B93_02900 [Pseudomonadales bacterium]